MSSKETTIPQKASPDRTLAETLKLHSEWVNSKGKDGEKASFRGTTHHEGNFTGKDLQGVDFTNADLQGASFKGANLDHTTFTNANLAGVNLDDATLQAAELFRCNFKNSSLCRTKLTEANLLETIFTEANLSQAELHRTTLNHADLKNCRLNQADFRDSTMKHVILDNAIMHGSKLQQADVSHGSFQNTDLSSANLRDAICPNARFQGANLKETILRDANLANADLVEAQGLMAMQLAGARLLGAKLPAAIAKFEGLTMVNVLCQRARTLFVAITSGCLYSWITLATTVTVASSETTTSVTLPIIATPVPIWIFHVMAPLVLIGSYIWGNIYLQGIWDALARLPSIFPDGSLLLEKVRTWLPIEIIQQYMPMMRQKPRFLSYLKIGVSIFLVWWLVPMTLLIFLGMNLPHQSQALSLYHLYHIALVVLALSLAMYFGRLCGKTLQRDGLKSPRFRPEKLNTWWQSLWK